jgi:methanogenic corrinoid protein MtbC1
VEEVARFQRETGLGLKMFQGDESVLKESAKGTRTKKSQSESPLFHSIVNGREEETASILMNAFMQSRNLPQIFDSTVTEAMCRVGELWFSGELTIAQEHLATQTVLSGLRKLRGIIPTTESNNKLALCCSVEGDLHELPVHLSQMESGEWEVLNFGPNLPFYIFSAEILHYKPQLVCISATILNDIERAAHDYRQFRAAIAKSNVSVVLGGRALADDHIRRRFPAELYAEKFMQLAEFAGKL